MTKAVIFDADGCLLDSMKYWMSLPSIYLEKFGKQTTLDFEKRIFSMSLQEGVESLKEEYGLKDSLDEIKNDLLSLIENSYKKEIPLKNGAELFLSKLNKKKIPLSVATAGNKELLVCALERLNILHFFREIYSCDQLGTDKTKPDIYLKAASDLQSGVEETLVFEDSLCPLQTAKNAGFKVVAVEDKSNSDEKNEIKKLCNLYISDFTDKKLWPFVSEN